MGKHVLLGYDAQGSSASPRVLYAGNSKSEALAAEAADTTSIRFERLSNVTGVRKNNPNYRPPQEPEGAADRLLESDRVRREEDDNGTTGARMDAASAETAEETEPTSPPAARHLSGKHKKH